MADRYDSQTRSAGNPIHLTFETYPSLNVTQLPTHWDVVKAYMHVNDDSTRIKSSLILVHLYERNIIQINIPVELHNFRKSLLPKKLLVM